MTERTSNDQRSDVKNRNNPENKSAMDNRSRQMDRQDKPTKGGGKK